MDLSSSDSAKDSIAVADSAINQLAELRALVGSHQNRLDYSSSLLLANNESRELGRSNLEDADFALESAKLAKSLVLQSVNSALIAQANANSNLVLQLIG